MGLGPEIADAPAPSWQVIKAVQPVEVVNWKVAHGLGICKAQVDGHSAPSVGPKAEASPRKDARTGRAEEHLQRGVILAPAAIAAARALNVDTLAFVVIGPKRAVPSA